MSRSKNGRQQIIKKLAGNLILMGRFLMPEAFTMPTPDFHYDVAGTLQNPAVRRLNGQWPRDHAKSTICAALKPIWHLWFEHVYRGKHRRRRFIVIISKTQREAKRRLRTLMEAIESKQAKSLMGDWGRKTARKWTEEEVILKDGSAIISTGWSQQGRGLKEGHQRPSLLVIDDPEDENNTKTVEQMENNLEWLLSALEPAVAPRGEAIVIGTPIHQRSMVNVLQDFDSWRTIHYKALYEEDGEEKALWPERWPVERLKEKRAEMRKNGREHLFYRDYQCQILRGESSPIKPEHFRYWDGRLEVVKRGPFTRHFLHVTHRGRDEDGNPLPLEEPETIPVCVTMGVDPASSQSRQADYSTIVPVAWGPNGEAYVLPYFRERVDPVDHARRIYSFYQHLRPIQTRVEQDGYQRMLRSYLTDPEHFDERIPGLEAEDSQAGSRNETKVERHLGMQYLFTHGNVHIQPHMETFKEEWLLMDDASHDDLRDGFWWAHDCRRKPKHDEDFLDRDEERTKKKRLKDPMLA